MRPDARRPPLGAAQPRLPSAVPRPRRPSTPSSCGARRDPRVRAALRDALRRLSCEDDDDDRSSPRRGVDDDAQYEAGLRPRTLDEYIGQDRVRENLHVSIAAARSAARRSTTCCCTARPASGKTTLAYVIANELGVPIRTTAGPVHREAGRPGGDADEPAGARGALHRRDPPDEPPAIEEILYPAMEDYELDIVIGQGPGARSVKVPLQRSRSSAPRRARGC
jgi:hypothetical protein